MSRSDTREALVRRGCEIIARQGFNSTGINAVLTDCGVPKGSFYYYFASKDEFGLAVIEYLDARINRALDRALDEAEASPLERLRNYFDAGIRDMSASSCCEGCPIGNLGQELAGQNEIFRQRLDAVFNGWQDRIANCLAAARDLGEIPAGTDVGQMAEFMLSSWEGATLRAKVSGSVAPMQRCMALLFERLLAAPGVAA